MDRETLINDTIIQILRSEGEDINIKDKIDIIQDALNTFYVKVHNYAYEKMKK